MVRTVSRSIRCLACLVIVASAACGQSSSKQERAALGGELLVLRTPQGITTIDQGRRQVVVQGVAAALPDWSLLYTTAAHGTETSLLSLDPRSGARRSILRTHGRFVVSAVSASGRSLALVEPRPGVPARGRRRTTVVVANPPDRRTRRFSLPGNFEPEAFSTDEGRLFLIEYLPPERPDRYRVRELDLASGAVAAVGARIKQPAPEEMRGTGRMHALSPDGKVLYTLYTRQGPNYAHGETPEQLGPPNVRTHAFVHVLNLAGWAHCVDLPHPFGTTLASANSLAVSPDGTRLYVVDGLHGQIAMIDTGNLRVLGTAHPNPPVARGRVEAAAGRDGALYVGTGSDILVLAGPRLAPTHLWKTGGPIAGLRVSGDGQRLYVATRDRITMLDTGSGRELGTLDTPGVESILYVG